MDGTGTFKRLSLTKPGTAVGHAHDGLGTRNADDNAPPSLLQVTAEIAAAAAPVAEADATANASGFGYIQKRASFWMQDIQRRGSHPVAWGGSEEYKIFRNVKDYGARGDGTTDDTQAIRNAMIDGDRCGERCNGATNKNAIVYFPPGKYLVSGTIPVIFGTQLIGDANERPEIVAAASFVGLGVLSTNEYVPDGGIGADGKDKQWYINTGRFYGQIRNFKIDITRTDPNAYVCAIHYQVAQVTSPQDVELIADSSTTQQGMFSENGSGGVMSDVTFRGGNFGFYGGNQQFTAQRMKFIGCNTAVQIIWDWGWLWKSVSVEGGDRGFVLLPEGGAGSIGSVAFLDSTFKDVETAIVTGTPNEEPGTDSTGLIIENCAFSGVTKAVATADGDTLLEGGGNVVHWVLGPVYKDGKRTWASGASSEYSREESLLASDAGGLPQRPYFERKRTQYADRDVGSSVHAKDYGAVGDGETDDTEATQAAFDAVSDGSKILFVDAGVYMLRDTVTIPKNAKIVGECWATFAAVGERFSDASKPRAVIRVGESGDVGNAELQDLIVLTKGGTPGAVLIEWNVQAESQGSAALWDVHARVGGALGTEQTPAECPPITTGTNPVECQVAALLMHITPKASGLFDNMWLWVADHLIDDPLRDDENNNMDQLSIYAARGLLVESRHATWLYGTSAEHCVLYQYNFHEARNIFAGMVQTEPPYFQPTPNAPAPFTQQVGGFRSDPGYNCSDDNDFDGCDTGWAVIVTASENILIAAAGTYSWFDAYTQECIGEHACQKALWYLEGNFNNVRIQHLITIGSKYMLVSDGEGVLATDNLATEEHPQWSHVSVYEARSNGVQPGNEAACDRDDRTYTKPKEVKGEWYPSLQANLIDWDQSVAKDKTYVNIVNLTPYTFHLDHTEFCQMDRMDFADIPPGQSRQNVMDYYGGKGTPVDEKGEAYYTIGDTGKKFVVMARTNIPNFNPLRTKVELGGFGLGVKEYPGRGGQRAINLVITGSEEYGGYYSSMYAPPIGWMQELKDVIGPRTLNNVVMPGTHNSGMSVIGSWTFFGTKENSQNQGYNIYDQLRLGARWFDLRIISMGSGINFHTAHTNYPTALSVGATGVTLDEVVGWVNRFTDEHPGEVIFLWTSYLWTLIDDMSGPDNRPMTDRELDELFKVLRRIKRRCPDLDAATKFNMRTMESFMSMNDGEGCVLIMLDGRDITKESPKDGIYDGRSHLSRDNHWSNTHDGRAMAADQTEGWKTMRDDPNTSEKFFISQWLGTYTGPSTNLLPLEELALRSTHDTLFWAGAGNMSPSSFPNVMMVDYLGVEVTRQNDWDDADHSLRALAIGLNLYMISENCEISKGLHPLRHPRATTSSERGSQLLGGGVRVDRELFAKQTLIPMEQVLERRQQNNCP